MEVKQFVVKLICQSPVMRHCSPVTKTTQEGGKGEASTQIYRTDKNVRKTLRSILELSETDVFSTWIRLLDGYRELAWRNRGGSQYQLSSPWQHLPPEVVLAQLITAAPRASHPSSPAEEIPWA